MTTHTSRQFKKNYWLKKKRGNMRLMIENPDTTVNDPNTPSTSDIPDIPDTPSTPSTSVDADDKIGGSSFNQPIATFTKEQRKFIRASFLNWRKCVLIEAGLNETDACAHLGKLQIVYGAPCNPNWGTQALLTKVTGLDKATLTRLFTDGGRGTLLAAAMVLDNNLGGGPGLWAAAKKLAAKEKISRLETRKELLKSWFEKNGPLARARAELKAASKLESDYE